MLLQDRVNQGVFFKITNVEFMTEQNNNFKYNTKLLTFSYETVRSREVFFPLGLS